MRAQKLAVALAITAALLGTLHIALTPLAYAAWTVEALWFLGAGLAIVMAAVANIVGRPFADRPRRIMVATINLTMAIFFASAWLVLPAPQVLVGGVLFLSLAVCAVAPQGSKAATS
ncbi:MAG: hypothetical protein H2054_12540 [Sphingomonas sp.]|uniref:hypothetical protein n=1 Tax=Sphingomonas sp. TaxID=28214 RepID=UPI000DB4CFAB|nr:hypothetical protein [Zymomonas sp.]MBA4773912.1 hypothetical protein [Sphingomonas sp.]PZP14145.1 MAG: hypothetical protein DI607_08180 [Sphingomonas hengshuiensis]